MTISARFSNGKSLFYSALGVVSSSVFGLGLSSIGLAASVLLRSGAVDWHKHLSFLAIVLSLISFYTMFLIYRYVMSLAQSEMFIGLVEQDCEVKDESDHGEVARAAFIRLRCEEEEISIQDVEDKIDELVLIGLSLAALSFGLTIALVIFLSL